MGEQVTYDASEQDILLDVFRDMLKAVTKDGGNKRARGEKPEWWKDPAHKAAIFSHLTKRERGELADPDSGAHPYVHVAWRALAIAYQETYGLRDPATFWNDKRESEWWEATRPPEVPEEIPTAEWEAAERIQYYEKKAREVKGAYACIGSCEDCTCNDEEPATGIFPGEQRPAEYTMTNQEAIEGGFMAGCKSTYYHLGEDRQCELPDNHAGPHENWHTAALHKEAPLQWSGKASAERAS